MYIILYSMALCLFIAFIASQISYIVIEFDFVHLSFFLLSTSCVYMPVVSYTLFCKIALSFIFSFHSLDLIVHFAVLIQNSSLLLSSKMYVSAGIPVTSISKTSTA